MSREVVRTDLVIDRDAKVLCKIDYDRHESWEENRQQLDDDLKWGRAEGSDLGE